MMKETEKRKEGTHQVVFLPVVVAKGRYYHMPGVMMVLQSSCTKHNKYAKYDQQIFIFNIGYVLTEV